MLKDFPSAVRPPPDIDLEQIVHVQNFMADVRKLQAETGRTAGGRINISAEQLRSIERAESSSNLVRSIQREFVSKEDMRDLFERFEEMCRRRQKPVPQEARDWIVRQLALEFWLNAQALESSKKLVSFTLYQGARAKDLLEAPEYAEMRGTLSIFRRAAQSYPTQPDLFLRNLIEATTRLRENPRFTELKGMPSVIRLVAMYNPLDPEAALDRVMAQIHELREDSEFKLLWSAPSLLALAALRRPQKTKEFLRSVIGRTSQLENDPAFAELKETRPAIFKQVAFTRGNQAEEFLQTVIQREPDPFP